ncbi:MAG: hypothetical protein HC873_22375 [Leptolyngbyaceae cyanobacterium SL_1_1]|nr:hypothetical protein [Leptolyngbyaceae cyanobacterium SL_1_1]
MVRVSAVAKTGRMLKKKLNILIFASKSHRLVKTLPKSSESLPGIAFGEARD